MCGFASAQTPAEILAQPAVKAAMESIKTHEPHFVDEQIRLCEIAAPDFHEETRAAELAKLFREAGLENVRIDHAGNVLGDRLGAAPQKANNPRPPDKVHLRAGRSVWVSILRP